MLRQLSIQNIILIESATIDFEPGFNVLSGETGSGKSAIMHALGLVLGGRADTSIIRKGCEKGSVEALIEVGSINALRPLLTEMGIDCEGCDDLILRREIHSSGKSRAFLNQQMVQIAALRKVGSLLVDFVSQHANQNLLELEYHREAVDLFGGLQPLQKTYSESWLKEKTLKEELEQLIQNESKRIREIEICQMELEELQSANLKENEEEEFFAEYSLLANAENLTQKVEQLLQSLNGEKNGVLGTLARQRTTFESLSAIDPSLKESALSFNNALIELQEISYTMQAYQGRIEINPDRMAEVNERLQQINRLKKKYGSSIAEIQRYQRETEEKLNRLNHAESQIEELEKLIQSAEQETAALASQLSQQRKKTISLLDRLMTSELRSLNMPKVDFFSKMHPQTRNSHGDEKIEFYLLPNIGENPVPVKECASGGELSRVMLALKTLLAGKEEKATLIFDEIDANIGGETATNIGIKLQSIGTNTQVLCITHFSQVAVQANHHLRISKKEAEGRTFTLIETLNPKEREKELNRMVGKQCL
jgi:DNA repair protein RecN (Recombination protein N)